MSDDVPLTRRHVLAGLAGAGALGSGAGAFTAATLGDRELLPIGTTAGAAGISVDCDAADCVVENGVLQFAIDVAPGETQRRSFTLAVDDNPVRVWARTECPPEPDDDGDHGSPDDWPWHGRRGEHSRGGEPPEIRPPDRPPSANESVVRVPEAPRPTFGGGWSRPSLVDVLKLRLSIANPCGSAGTRLYPEESGGPWGTLRDFQTAFADGRRLDADEPCFESDDGVCLELEYRLPWRYAFAGRDDEADLELELYAEQCRHVDESSVGSPFEPAGCGSEPDPDPDPDPDPEPGRCPDCSKLGKLEVQGDRLETAVYAFDELYGQFEDDDHDYELDVLDVTNKDGGAETVCVEFALLRDGEETLEMCKVKLKGGWEEWFEELDPPATRTPSRLCTGEVEAGNSGNHHQPAISHLTVYVCDDGPDHGDGGHGEERHRNGAGTGRGGEEE